MKNQREKPLTKPVGYIPPSRRKPLPGALTMKHQLQRDNTSPLTAPRVASPGRGSAGGERGRAVPQQSVRHVVLVQCIVQNNDSNLPCPAPTDGRRASSGCVLGAAECVPPAPVLLSGQSTAALRSERGWTDCPVALTPRALVRVASLRCTGGSSSARASCRKGDSGGAKSGAGHHCWQQRVLKPSGSAAASRRQQHPR
jgi:hypothetical protein